MGLIIARIVSIISILITFGVTTGLPYKWWMIKPECGYVLPKGYTLIEKDGKYSIKENTFGIDYFVAVAVGYKIRFYKKDVSDAFFFNDSCKAKACVKIYLEQREIKPIPHVKIDTIHLDSIEILHFEYTEPDYLQNI